MTRMISSLTRMALSGSLSRGAAYSVRQASTLVIAEHEGPSLTPSSLSAVAAAGFLGESNSISLLVAGSDRSALEAIANQASTIHPSISQVLVAASEKLKHSLAESWASLICLAHQERNFSHIIVASSSFGKNILPRAAALLNVSPVTDVIRIIDDTTFVRPIYAGNALSTVRYKSSAPCMLSVRPTSFSLNTSEATEASVPISSLDVHSLDSDSVVSSSLWLEEVSQQSERPDLGNAKVVVSGGRALKSAENFKLLETLADKLGGAVGATRAAVDAGYVPNDLQVGQTGKIVAPELYIAIGVSGAIQHLAGMKDSKVIVAINKDADAPIFQIADYGLVGDLFDIIPEMLDKLPDKKLH